MTTYDGMVVEVMMDGKPAQRLVTYGEYLDMARIDLNAPPAGAHQDGASAPSRSEAKVPAWGGLPSTPRL